MSTEKNAVLLEEEVRNSVEVVRSTASGIEVVDDASYAKAAELLKAVAERRKQVQAYWKTPKEAASKAHKEIVAKEKDMLEPLSVAENHLKKAIGNYTLQVEARRRAEQAEQERLRAAERERLLAEAVKAEQSGDVVAMETNLIMAEVVEDIKSAAPATATPKTEGISVRKTWKARVVDDSKVPVVVGGVVVRPIDMGALNNFARMTKGSMDIPGVEFYEDATLAVR